MASIFRQLLAALSHLHAQGILHMDVKPENIVYATPAPDSPIKLIDFSLACFFNTPTEPGGTPEFVAPELLADPEKYAAKVSGAGWLCVFVRACVRPASSLPRAPLPSPLAPLLLPGLCMHATPLCACQGAASCI